MIHDKTNPAKNFTTERGDAVVIAPIDNSKAGFFIMDGWVKLHRRFLDWEWFDDSNMVKLFIFLLLNANHKEGVWRGIKIKRGQYITGLKSLSQKTKLTNQTLRTCLKRLQKTGEINRQTNNQYSVITISNYNDYQEKINEANKQTNKQLTSDQQATNKQLTTNKNKKKKKNDNNNKEEKVVYPFKQKEFIKAWETWIEYKNTQFKFKFKSISTEQIALNSLKELSKENLPDALKIIDRSIANGWKGFFELEKPKKIIGQMNAGEDYKFN